VTLNGPEERFRNLSFVANDNRLGDAISEVIQEKKTVAPKAPSAGRYGIVTPPIEAHKNSARDRHSCEACQKAFVVTFEAQPGEARVLTAVACPYCWHINRVEIGAWAASGHDFQAEKA
jgi:hypothetical protein